MMSSLLIFAMVNLCGPLMPISPLKPSSGTFEDPVTNYRNSARSEFSS